MPSPLGVPEAGSLSSCPPADPFSSGPPQGPDSRSPQQGPPPRPSHRHVRGQSETGWTPLNPRPRTPPEPSRKSQDIPVPFSSPQLGQLEGTLKGHLHPPATSPNVCLSSAPAQCPRQLRPRPAPLPPPPRAWPTSPGCPQGAGGLQGAGRKAIRRPGDLRRRWDSSLSPPAPTPERSRCAEPGWDSSQ